METETVGMEPSEDDEMSKLARLLFLTVWSSVDSSAKRFFGYSRHCSVLAAS